jgi:hypothetical protein
MDDIHETNSDASANGEDEFIASIASDVMKVSADRGFFEKLDDMLSPALESDRTESCRGKYEISDALLRSLGFDQEELTDIFQVLRSRGGFCDCEILYNVSEENRLKAKYWRAGGGN